MSDFKDDHSNQLNVLINKRSERYRNARDKTEFLAQHDDREYQSNNRRLVRDYVWIACNSIIKN
jgi:hypothetical protein